eukprot:TRINITY_DN3108_c0_g2_i1.p2 TRINITY_DN3108_c0_g2~~TRINITY_DN3108_c0_g2_i1.p2  ORF type:complete len:150 (+),score=38.40 TRINITY_DN3108_c0_g2_i1:233-682(+)
MKFNTAVTGSRRKQRKAHFTANPNERRRIMSCGLSKDLFNKHNVGTVPIRKDDEVRVMRGTFKGREGKVVRVHRAKYVIHIEKITKEKSNGATAFIGIQPSNCQVIKLKLDKDRKALLERRDRTRAAQADKGKISASQAESSTPMALEK